MSPPTVPDPAPAPGEPALGRVLIVDDDVAVCTMLARLLAKAGYAVTASHSGAAALPAIVADEYDVALIDLHMPGISGLDLLAELAARKAPVVPVLLTGTTDVAAAVEGMKRGAFDYVPKPTEPGPLRWTVARAVQAAHGRRRERALERVVGEWAATFDACPDVLLVVDRAGRVLRANAAAVALVGWDPLDQLLDDALPNRLGVAIAGACSSLWKGPAPPPASQVVGPEPQRCYQVTVNPLGGGPDAAVVVARDVTTLTRAEEVRTRLMRELLTAQEDERRRIARELHDGIGQLLASLAVGLVTIADDMPPDPARDRAVRLQQIAAETLNDVRRIAHGLRPSVLDDHGLAAALTHLVDGFGRVHGIRAECVLALDPDERLPTEVENAFYRIVQEALTNAAKHSCARSVDVVLEVADQTARVTISDDGVGMTERPPGRGSGIGVTGIRERARLLGGTVRIAAAADRGTTIDVCVPIRGGAS